MLLPDDVLIENLLDRLGLGDLLHFEGRGVRGLLTLGELLVEDLVAQIDAFVANIDPRRRNQLADLVLGFTTERALGVPFSVFVLR